MFRERLLQARRRLSESDRATAAQAIAAHVLALPEVARARTVACYLSLPTEPGTRPLIDGLVERGIEVLIPAVDGDALDWVVFDPDVAIAPGPLGVPEPVGERLGPQTIERADFVIVPGLAVDGDGMRLGRGRGFYDRLIRQGIGPTCVLLFADEVLASVPSEPHDERVNMVVTPLGVARLTLS